MSFKHCRTLLECSRHGAFVIVACKRCGHRRRYTPTCIAAAFGIPINRHIRELRFGCYRCGAGAASINKSAGHDQMTDITLFIDDTTALALVASMRLRGESPSRWLQDAVHRKLGQDVARVPPIGARKHDDDHEAFAALVDYVLAIE